MPQFVTNVRGQRVTLFTQEERDLFISAWGKSASAFTESPDWAVPALGGVKLFHYVVNPMEGDWWSNNFSTPETLVPKPGFYEIFTGGLGPLTSAEVQAEIERTGVRINAVHACSVYNNKLDKDHELYTEDLDMGELKALLAPADFERLQVVDAWLTSLLESAPVYFGFSVDKVTAETVTLIEGVPHVEITNTAKVPSIGVAFVGRHSMIRDVFSPGIGVWDGPGVKSVDQPGRDRPYRITGVGAFTAFLWSPVLVITRMQIEQLLQGRAVTIESSPLIPPGLLSR